MHLRRSHKDDPRDSNLEEMQRWQADRDQYLERRRDDERRLAEEHRSTQEMFKEMQVGQSKEEV